MLIDLPDDLYPDFSTVRISADHDSGPAPSSCAMQQAVAAKHGSTAAQRHSVAGSGANSGAGVPYRGQQSTYTSGGAVRSGYGGPAAVPKPVLRPHAIPIRKPGEAAPSKATDSTSCGSSTSSTSSPPTPAVKPPAPAAPSAVKPPGATAPSTGGARTADGFKQQPVGTASGGVGSRGGSNAAPAAGDAGKGLHPSGKSAPASSAAAVGGATKSAPALPARVGMNPQGPAAGPASTVTAAGAASGAGRGPAGPPGARPAGPPQPMGQGGAARPLQQQHAQQQRCGPQPPPPPPRAAGGAAVHMGNRAGMGPMPVAGAPLRAAPGPLAGAAPASAAAAAAAGPRAAPGIPLRSGGLLGPHAGVPGAQGPGRVLPRGPPAPLQLPRSSDGGASLPSPAATCSAGATPTSTRQQGLAGRQGPLGSSGAGGDAAYGPQDVRAEAAAGGPAAAAGGLGRGLGPRSPVGPLPSPGHRGPLPEMGSAAAAAGGHVLGRHMPNGAGKAGPTHLSGRHGCTVTVVPGSALQQLPMRPGVVNGRPAAGMINTGVSSQDVRAEAGLSRVGSGNSSSSSSSTSSSNGGPPAMRLATPGAGPGPVLKSPGADPSTTAARAPPMLQPLRGMAREALASPPAGPWGPSYGPKHPAAVPSGGWGAQGQPVLGPSPGSGAMGPRGGPPSSNHPSVLQPSTPQGRVAAPAGGPAAASVPKGGRSQNGASSQDVRVADTRGHSGATGGAYHAAAAGALLSPVGPPAPPGRAAGPAPDAGAKAAPAPGALERQQPGAGGAGGGKVKGPSMLQQHLRKLSQQGPGAHANQPAAPGTPRIQSHGKSVPAVPSATGAAPGAGQGAKAGQKGGVDQGRPGGGEGSGKTRKGASGGAQAQPLLSMTDATKRLLRAGEGAPVWMYLDAAGAKVGPCQGPELHARLSASKVDYDTLVCGFTHAPPPDARLMTAFFQPLQALVETVQAGGRYDPLVPGPARG